MTTTKQTALLVMDVQPNIVERLAEPDEYLGKIKQAVETARGKHIPIIYVVVGFRPGFPEVVVTKRRVSAFTGSDLEVVLRGLDARHIVLTGIATSGVVLSTLREAADKDYRITVLSDLCADMDDEVHRVLIEKVFPRQADVTTAEAWFAAAG
jgi:nicotinamidase-related amidase